MDRLHLTDPIVNYVSFRSERGYQRTNPRVTEYVQGAQFQGARQQN
jgi:hypothetical protein